MSKQRRGKRAANISSFLCSLSPLHSLCLPQGHSLLFTYAGGATVKNLPANAGDTGDVGSIPGSGRSSGAGHGKPLQYSCLENPME